MLLPWGFREYPGDFSRSGRGPRRAWAPGRPRWPFTPGSVPAAANGSGSATPANGSVPDPANGSGPTPGHGAAPDQAAPLRVSARHLNLALDELLDSRHDLTRVLLGSRPMRGADAIIRPVLPHLRPSR